MLRAARLSIVAILAGCGSSEPAGLSRDQFVDAYIRMVRARIESEGDSAAFAAARERALKEAGVSAREMRDFVADGRERPEELRAAWVAIAAKLDTLYGGVTSEPPPSLRRSVEPAPAAAVDSATLPRPTAPPNIPPDTGAARSLTAPPNIPPDTGATGEATP